MKYFPPKGKVIVAGTGVEPVSAAADMNPALMIKSLPITYHQK